MPISSALTNLSQLDEWYAGTCVCEGSSLSHPSKEDVPNKTLSC